MNTTKTETRTSYRVVVDGYDMGRVYGGKNLREFVTKQEAKGRTVAIGR